ncbi:MAG: hypothetical protein WB947_05325 [Thermoplasmata archaeon]
MAVRKRPSRKSALSPVSADDEGSEKESGSVASSPARSDSVSSSRSAPPSNVEPPTVKGGPPLTPRTKETFDDLAKRVARAGPRRGSVVQPPPAWQPDEVTLGFAMVADESGGMRALAEPTLLATILIAVENDRRAILHRFAGGFDEEIDAVANLFWPFLVVHAEQGAAIFDGTGVWRRTFRYTLLPPVREVEPLLDRALPPVDYLGRMRALMPFFSLDPGAEVLTVEGFLPLDPPLLFDVLSQAQFRSDPQSAHAGFLPARHKVDWYESAVQEMREWLTRFENDLKTLTGIRAQIEAILAETRGRLEAEYRKRQEDGQVQVQSFLAGMDAEVARIEQSHHAEVQRYLDVIRRSQATVAHGQTVVATTETLAFRASSRRADGSAHAARGKQARADIRNAERQIAESRRLILQIHERQRSEQERAIAKVAELEKANAQALAQMELFHEEYVATGGDLLQTIDGQLAARTSQRNLLGGYFLPIPSLENVSVVWFPLWMATLRGPQGNRQLVFPPMQLRTGVGLGGALKRLFGGIVLPLEPRTAQFDKVLRPTMEDALAHDPWLGTATQELTRAADVLVDPDVLDRLRQGLADLQRVGWITKKQHDDFLRSYAERARRLAGGGPEGHGPVPAGARTEPYPGVGAPANPPPPTG